MNTCSTHEEEFTNAFGVPDTRIVRHADNFKFSATFDVQRIASMETNFRDEAGNLTASYQKGETYTEPVTHEYQAKFWNNARIYLTRKGIKGTIDCGYYDLQTKNFRMSAEFQKSSEIKPMMSALLKEIK